MTWYLSDACFSSKCQGFCVARLTFQHGPCPVIHQALRKVVPEVNRKGCCCLPIHFIITLSYLLTFHMEQRQTTQPHKKHTYCSADSDHCLPFRYSLRWRALRWDVTWCCALCWWLSVSSWTNVVLVNWTNVVVVVLVELTRISVSVSVVVFRNVPVISTFNLTFWLF